MGDPAFALAGAVERPGSVFVGHALAEGVLIQDSLEKVLADRDGDAVIDFTPMGGKRETPAQMRSGRTAGFVTRTQTRSGRNLRSSSSATAPASASRS